MRFFADFRKMNLTQPTYMTIMMNIVNMTCLTMFTRAIDQLALTRRRP